MDVTMVLFTTLVLAFALTARRLSRWYITAPIVFMATGALLDVTFDVVPGNEAVTVLAEATLALLLFHDSAQVRPRQIERDRGLVLRLLLIGLPLTIALGYVLGSVLLPELSWPLVLLVAAALAPTDAGLGAPTVLNPRLPVRVRRVLNVESGLNDGLATPVVLFALAAAAGGAELDGAAATREALVEIALGVLVGVLVGGGTGLLASQSRRKGWSSTTSRAFVSLALPLAAYAGAGEIGGNGFIAAFVTGTCYAATAVWVAEEASALALSETVAELLGFLVWLVVGLTVSRFLGVLGWQEVALAVLSLTLLRMGPVWLALLGTGLNIRTVAFIGWFGPRGLASVVFALLALEQLDGVAGVDQVLGVISLTVVLSVVLHGMTAEPGAQRLAAWVERDQPPVELGAAPEPQVRSRLFSGR